MTKKDKWNPLETHPITNEAFLRTRKHKDLIITPPRSEDVQNLFHTLNDQRVYHWLANTPRPYLPEDADNFWSRSKHFADAALKELEEANDFEPPRLVNSCPVAFVRKVQEDGSDEFVGNLVIGRCRNGELINTDSVDWDRKAQNEAENESKELGDPTILWSIGNFIVPKYQGQGIMTDVIETILQDWAVPRMGARRILVGAFEDNAASIRVFEKNGFRTLRTISKYRKIRGEYRNIRVMEWSLTAEHDDINHL